MSNSNGSDTDRSDGSDIHRYDQCDNWDCADEWEFSMLTWNGWPTRKCPFHAAVWERKGIAKLRSEVENAA